MKVILAITSRDGAETMADALKAQGFGVTIMGSMGGFLRRKSATLLIGLQDDQVEQALQIIQDNAPVQKPGSRTGLLGLGGEAPEVRTAAMVVNMSRFERFTP